MRPRPMDKRCPDPLLGESFVLRSVGRASSDARPGPPVRQLLPRRRVSSPDPYPLGAPEPRRRLSGFSIEIKMARRAQTAGGATVNPASIVSSCRWHFEPCVVVSRRTSRFWIGAAEGIEIVALIAVSGGRRPVAAPLSACRHSRPRTLIRGCPDRPRSAVSR